MAGLDRAHAVAERLLANVEQVVLGKTEQIRLVLAALASAATCSSRTCPAPPRRCSRARSRARSRAWSTRASSARPDLQPTDVTGLSVYDQRTREFEFRPGPVFANVVLVDEINRAMPKTQSALLEAMAERAGHRRRRHAPPARAVPRARDREPARVRGDVPAPGGAARPVLPADDTRLPGHENELAILRAQRREHPLEALEPAIGLDELTLLQDAVPDVYADELLERWIVALVEATRSLPEVAVGASVRGTLALDRTARAWALLHGRHYVVPADVDELFLPVLGHRLLLEPSFLVEAEELDPAEALARVKERCLAPRRRRTSARRTAAAAS